MDILNSVLPGTKAREVGNEPPFRYSTLGDYPHFERVFIWRRTEDFIWVDRDAICPWNSRVQYEMAIWPERLHACIRVSALHPPQSGVFERGGLWVSVLSACPAPPRRGFDRDAPLSRAIARGIVGYSPSPSRLAHARLWRGTDGTALKYLPPAWRRSWRYLACVRTVQVLHCTRILGSTSSTQSLWTSFKKLVQIGITSVNDNLHIFPISLSSNVFRSLKLTVNWKSAL